MQDLKYYQDKIKQKRMKTPFRDFLKEIVSWIPIVFYKNNWIVSRYPKTNRIKWVLSIKNYEENRDNLIKNWNNYNFSLNFLENFKNLYKNIPHSCLVHLWKNENSDFVDTAVNVKNTYLSNTITLWAENVFYSMLVRLNSKNVFNSISVNNNSEIIYFSRWVQISFKIFYSSYINNCNNIWF